VDVCDGNGTDRPHPAEATGFATDRPPDGEGWFNHPVAVTFTGTDAASGIAACTTLTYAGPDVAAAPLSGTCRDAAGHVSAPFAGTLRYDDTPPRITAARPERPPDHAGWYTTAGELLLHRHGCPVGRDAVPEHHVRRAGRRARPRGGHLRRPGGQRGTRAYGLRYDATAPRLGRPAAEPGDGSARLRWRLPADARTVRVTRVPGHGGDARSVVLRARRDALSDRGLRNGRTYSYRVTAVDAAGNGRRAASACGPARPCWRRGRGRACAGRRCCAGPRCAAPATTTSSSSATAARS
jgi:hypothetical protein